MVDYNYEVIFNEFSYKYLINSYLNIGYKFLKFDECNFYNGYVFLRHDVDFSLEFALEMAKWDNELGVVSTFFILPTTELYNMFSLESKSIINEIFQLGHDICLHIDEDVITTRKSLMSLVKSLKDIYPFLKTYIFSRHRPKLDFEVNIFGEESIEVYQDKFFKAIEYASDSRGEWKYGYPLKRKAFNNKSNFQLLIHPIWWMGNEMRRDKIYKLFNNNQKRVEKAIDFLDY